MHIFGLTPSYVGDTSPKTFRLSSEYNPALILLFCFDQLFMSQ